MAGPVFKDWNFEAKINIPILQTIQEFAKFGEEMKNDCLLQKIDDKIQEIYESININHEPLYADEIKTTLLLLRGNLDFLEQKPKTKKFIDSDIDDLKISADVRQFLTGGITLTLYAQDNNQKTFSVQLSKNLKQIVCRRPGERQAKQKWVMLMSTITDLKKGYDKKDKSSCFVKATGFFGSYPKPE